MTRICSADTPTLSCKQPLVLPSGDGDSRGRGQIEHSHQRVVDTPDDSY